MAFTKRLTNAKLTEQPARAGFSLTRRSFLYGMFSPVFMFPFSQDRVLSIFGYTEAEEVRDYSVCINADIILANPEMLEVLADAGVKGIWIATYFYGYWPYEKNRIIRAKELVEQKGMEAYAVTIPFGHPGDSLNAGDEAFPLIPPAHWPRTTDIRGEQYAGTTVNALVNMENAKALREVSELGFTRCMTDDDFRIARLPGVIGGSFDDETRHLFLQRGGYSSARWEELLDDIRNRRFTPIVKGWVDWYCDRMTESFRVQQNAFSGNFGIMVMYLGAEKAGIRLSDYRGVAVRVGEAHFSNRDLQSPKGWTDELFSVLFHRRYVEPDNAWSETTAFPADALSVENMCAKLTISTIADVRHTLLMSGLMPIPSAYWKILPAAMKLQKSIHQMIAGYPLKGPLKHYWGEASRYVGKDSPFSLWLATGIPFEVIDELEQGRDGWIFLSDEDYNHLDDNVRTGKLIVRPEVKKNNENVLGIKENLDALWIWRRSITARLKKNRTPYVHEEMPAVCAWYPDASSVLVWNLSAAPVSLAIQFGNRLIRKDYQPLESKLVTL